jgi:type 1 glutamine amidotransferase
MTRRRLLWWTAGLLVAVPLLVLLGGYTALRVMQPQMFSEPEFDEVAPRLPFNLVAGVLVYSKTSGGFRHGWSIDAANAMIGEFAERRSLPVFFTENAAVFNDEQLSRFTVVVWNNATGAALTESQRDSFRRWLEGGGGYVGLHAAGDGSHKDWSWYTEEVIRAPYNQHTLLPEHMPEATVDRTEVEHPATAHLPERWQAVEEWYAFHGNPRDRGSRILVTVDESSYTPGAASMGADHPMVWSHELGSGRVFYSAFGHAEEAYSDPLLRPMMERAIVWAGRLANAD